MSQFDWPNTKKKKRNKLKLWRLPKIEDSMERWSASPGEKGRTLGRPYEIKAGCYWEHPWGHIGNLMGTHWELEGNKGKKNPPPPPNLQEKNRGTLSAC